MLTGLPKRFLSPPSRWLLFAMLVSLHLVLWLGVASAWSRPLLLTHFGLFLLWQPLWRGERELSLGGLVFIACASAIAMFWLNLWLLGFWVAALFSLVGGRVFSFSASKLRFLYLAVMTYLLAALLMWIVPSLFDAQFMNASVHGLVSAVLTLLLLSTAFVPVEDELAEATQAETSQTVDLIYSLLLFMLLALLVLGSLAFVLLDKVDYLEALLRTLILIGVVLLALGWLWNPRVGFVGLQPLLSRYLLNLGTPLEGWLRRLADSAQTERSPETFMQRAAADLVVLPWLSGMSWQGPNGVMHTLGETTAHSQNFDEQGLRMTLYGHKPISPAVLLHIHLLTQLLGHFYQAKQREQRLGEVTRLQAVYETGARLTHDLKNMLQSLHALTSIAQRNEEEALPVMRWHLPVLMQRIEVALSKLKSPQLEDESSLLPVAVWWENLRQRHLHAALEWDLVGEPGDEMIPATLFDCVADNLIDNASNKRQQHPFMTIKVSLQVQPFSFAVCDAGDAIPTALAQQLMHTVVPSASGLGVGLYQAARWARQLGYQMNLRDNVDGKVRFDLVVSQAVMAAPAVASASA